MHEMALTRDIVDTVVEYGKRADAIQVERVHITIGYQRDIVDELFERCFAWLARGTIAERAELVITRVPLTVLCNRCGAIYPIDAYREDSWPCPSCRERDYLVRTGFEFYVDRIDVR